MGLEGRGPAGLGLGGLGRGFLPSGRDGSLRPGSARAARSHGGLALGPRGRGGSCVGIARRPAVAHLVGGDPGAERVQLGQGGGQLASSTREGQAGGLGRGAAGLGDVSAEYPAPASASGPLGGRRRAALAFAASSSLPDERLQPGYDASAGRAIGSTRSDRPPRKSGMPGGIGGRPGRRSATRPGCRGTSWRRASRRRPGPGPT